MLDVDIDVMLLSSDAELPIVADACEDGIEPIVNGCANAVAPAAGVDVLLDSAASA